MTKASDNQFPSVLMVNTSNASIASASPWNAGRLFFDDDGILKKKDSAGSVTTLSGSGITNVDDVVTSADKISFASNFVVSDQGSGDALVDIFFPAGGGASAIDDLSDVDTDKSKTPADGDVLTFDGTDWNAEAAGGGGVSDLGDLGDVTVSGSETDGQVLTSDGAGGFAFEDAAAGGGIDAGALTLLGRDDESETEDDNFDGGSVDAKWLAYTGHDATLSVAAGDGWVAASSSGAKLQAVPGGGWSSIEAEFIAPDYLAAAYGNIGLILTNGTTESSATDARWGIGGDNTLGTKRFVSEEFGNGSFITTYKQTTGLRYMPQRYRLRIVKDGTDYHFDYAFGDGGTWTRYYTESTLGFTPSHFGIHMANGAKVNYFKVTI